MSKAPALEREDTSRGKFAQADLGRGDVFRFGIVLTALTASAALVLTWPVANVAGSAGVAAWWVGAGVSLVNCAWGTALLVHSLRQGPRAFQTALYVGVLGRMAIVFAVVGALHAVGGVDSGVLVLSVVGFYFLGVVVELRFLFGKVLGTKRSFAGGRSKA